MVRSVTVGLVAVCGAVAVSGVLMTGGGSDDAGRDAVVRTDSAGVEWIRHGRTEEPSPVDALERRRIGVIEGPAALQFALIRAIESRGDRIYVLDTGDNTIRVYGHDGSVAAVFGGRGDGPGEFAYPHRMVVGDSVYVADPQANRLSVFDLDGTFVRDEPLGSTTEVQLIPLARRPDGWIAERLDLGLFGRRERDRLHADTTFVTFVRELAETGSDPALALENGRSGAFGPGGFHLTPLFEPRGAVAMEADGTLYHARGLPYRIDVHDRRGHHVRRIERDHPEVAISEAAVDEYLEYQRGVFEPLPPSDERDMMLEAYLETRMELPRPGYRPPVGRLLVGPAGSLLIERPDLDPHPFSPIDPPVWDHLGPAGDLLGRVTFPPRTTPLALGAEGVWARHIDELGVHYAVLYGIRGKSDADPN